MMLILWDLEEARFSFSEPNKYFTVVLTGCKPPVLLKNYFS